MDKQPTYYQFTAEDVCHGTKAQYQEFIDAVLKLQIGGSFKVLMRSEEKGLEDWNELQTTIDTLEKQYPDHHWEAQDLENGDCITITRRN